MKLYTLIFTMSFFAIGCSSSDDGPTADEAGEGTTTGTVFTGSIESCNGDTPVNVDGYFDSFSSPRSLVLVPNENESFVLFQDAVEIDNYSDYRIGVSAAYNLGVNGGYADPAQFGHPKVRATCAPAGRYTVGPVLTSLTITANLPIGDNYPAGSELNNAFLIAPLQRAGDDNYPPTQAYVPTAVPSSTDYFPLLDFLQTEPLAPVAFLLLMDTQPTSTENHDFTITYTLSSGLSGSAQVPSVKFK